MPTMAVFNPLIQQLDLFVENILTFLTPTDLVVMSQLSKQMNTLIFGDDNWACQVIFKSLVYWEVRKNVGAAEVYNCFPFNSTSDSVQKKNWKTIYRDNFLLCFDTVGARSSSWVLSERNLVIDTDGASGEWHHAIVKLPMHPGSIHKWTFLIENYESCHNSYELVMGAAVFRKSDPDFNSDRNTVWFLPSNRGIGINTGLWEKRIEKDHEIFEKALACPDSFVNSEFGFEFDYTSSSPVLKIYFNRELVTTVQEKNTSYATKDDVFYPTVSACRYKRIRVGPWTW